MNRRSALKAMSGAAAMCLLGVNFHRAKGFPVAKFEDHTQDTPECLWEYLGEGSTITQPRLTNGDEVLGDWKLITEPDLDFDAAIFDHLRFPIPLPPDATCLTRSNLVFLDSKDAFRAYDDDNELVKIYGVVQLTQIRWRDSQVTGVNIVDRTWCIKQSEEDALKELGIPTT